MTHLTRPSQFSSILLNSSRALVTLELSLPIISYTADTTLKKWDYVFLFWCIIIPSHLVEVDGPVAVHVVHPEGPGQLLLGAAVTGGVQGQHELSKEDKVGCRLNKPKESISISWAPVRAKNLIRKKRLGWYHFLFVNIWNLNLKSIVPLLFVSNVLKMFLLKLSALPLGKILE